MKKLKYKTLMLLCFTMFTVSTASTSWSENKNIVSSNSILRQSHNYRLTSENLTQYKVSFRGIGSKTLTSDSSKFSPESNHEEQEVRLGKQYGPLQPKLLKLLKW